MTFVRYFKISFGILILLAATRFIPHPPNFTSLIALSFYVPALMGVQFIPALLLSFLITDIFIGFHSLTIFTWGSVIIIGIISKYFVKTTSKRLFGTLVGALIFFVITNFGVWTLGSYGYTLNGLISCFILAIPFFKNTIISTILFSIIIEFALYMWEKNIRSKKLIN